MSLIRRVLTDWRFPFATLFVVGLVIRLAGDRDTPATVDSVQNVESETPADSRETANASRQANAHPSDGLPTETVSTARSVNAPVFVLVNEGRRFHWLLDTDVVAIDLHPARFEESLAASPMPVQMFVRPFLQMMAMQSGIEMGATDQVTWLISAPQRADESFLDLVTMIQHLGGVTTARKFAASQLTGAIRTDDVEFNGLRYLRVRAPIDELGASENGTGEDAVVNVSGTLPGQSFRSSSLAEDLKRTTMATFSPNGRTFVLTSETRMQKMLSAEPTSTPLSELIADRYDRSAILSVHATQRGRPELEPLISRFSQTVATARKPFAAYANLPQHVESTVVSVSFAPDASSIFSVSLSPKSSAAAEVVHETLQNASGALRDFYATAGPAFREKWAPPVVILVDALMENIAVSQDSGDVTLHIGKPETMRAAVDALNAEMQSQSSTELSRDRQVQR